MCCVELICILTALCVCRMRKSCSVCEEKQKESRVFYDKKNHNNIKDSLLLGGAGQTKKSLILNNHLYCNGLSFSRLFLFSLTLFDRGSIEVLTNKVIKKVIGSRNKKFC